MLRTRLAALTAITVLAGAAPAFAEPLDPDRLSDVAERSVQSVVSISVEAVRESDFDPWLNDPRSPFYMGPNQQTLQGAGSGVIVSETGRILTNAHVVNGAETLTVTLSDGTELDAKVVGLDVPTDIAVIQLTGDVPKLRPIPIGDSGELRLGEIVLAIGNPLGIGQSVSWGIVSAKGRGLAGLVDYADFIQTDASINPGNSGGALVNLDGELVGINTAIASRSGGDDGIGFAIPTSMAMPVMKALVEDGKVVRGYIGVTLAQLSRKLAAEKKLSVKRGVLVHEVLDGAPAAKAGLSAGDVIVKADGRAVTDLARLRNHIAMKGANQPVELEVVRGEKTRVIQVTTAAFPDAPKAKVKKAKSKGKRRR